MKYDFWVGVSRQRSITVDADTLEEADKKARNRLDVQAMRNGREAPVRWDLNLKNETKLPK